MMRYSPTLRRYRDSLPFVPFNCLISPLSSLAYPRRASFVRFHIASSSSLYCLRATEDKSTSIMGSLYRIQRYPFLFIVQDTILLFHEEVVFMFLDEVQDNIIVDDLHIGQTWQPAQRTSSFTIMPSSMIQSKIGLLHVSECVSCKNL